MEKIVLVNRSDQILGTKAKLACHRSPGVLHRAFAAFVLNDKGEVLLSKRSRNKPLWPLYWENTCSSHPYLGETYTQAGERRLSEELGFTTSLKYLFKFYYQADYNSRLSEHEVCAVLVGRYSGKIRINPKEILNTKWLQFSKLKREIKYNGFSLAPWLTIAVNEIEILSQWRRIF
jgi:isopentenyl-diphosphate delta-isomerase